MRIVDLQTTVVGAPWWELTFLELGTSSAPTPSTSNGWRGTAGPPRG
jgi:hypothetical protein